MIGSLQKRSWLRPSRSSTPEPRLRCRCTNRRVGGNFTIRCGCEEYEDSGKTLGEGNTATVGLLRQRRTGHLYAAKRFKNFSSKPEVFATNVLAEFYVANGFKHPSIAQTYELRMLDGVLNMIMEYAPHNLFEMVTSKSVTVADAEVYFKQLVAGVAYIHSTGFAHRDLKLENVLVKNGHVKIIDFGTISTGRWTPTASVGSEPYMAPELFTASHYHPQLADAWSLGIIYACMILGRFPWPIAQESRPAFRSYALGTARTSTGTFTCDSDEPIWPISTFPTHMQSALAIMLQIDPKQRPMLEGVPRLLREHALQT